MVWSSSFPKRRKWSIGLVFGCVLVSMSVAPSYAGVPESLIDGTWYRARSENFTVINGVRKGFGQAAAQKLEQLGALLTHQHPGLRAAPPLPTVVYLLTQEQFEVYARKPGAAAAAFFQPADDRNFLVVNADLDKARTETLAHEFVHLFVLANFPGLPLWLNEGLAEYYSTLTVKGQYAVYGHRQDFWVYVLENENLLSMDLLFATTAGSHAYTHGSEYGMRFYAQSWALTHYLFDDPHRAEKVTDLLNAVHAGARTRTAFERVFPASVKGELPTAIEEHIARDWFESHRFKVGEALDVPRPKTRQLSRTETLRNLAMLLQARREPDMARDHFAASIAANDGNMIAHVQLGFLEDAEGQAETAEAHYAKAFELAPDRSDVMVTAARGALRRGFLAIDVSRDKARSAFELARERFQKCQAERPTDPLVAAGYGLSFVLSSTPPENAIAGAARAFESLPYRTDIGMNLLHLYAKTGREEEAQVLLDERLRAILSPTEFLRAQELIGRGPRPTAGRSDGSEGAAGDKDVPNADLGSDGARTARGALFGEASEAAKRGDLERARQLFEGLRNSAATAHERESLDEILRELEARIMFEKGAKLMEAGNFKAALKAFESMDVDGLAGELILARNAMVDHCRVTIGVAAAQELVRQGKLVEARAKLQAIDTQSLLAKSREKIEGLIRELSEAIEGR